MPITYQVDGMPTNKNFQRSSNHDYKWAIVRYTDGKPVEAVSFRRELNSATSEMMIFQKHSFISTYQVHPVVILVKH